MRSRSQRDAHRATRRAKRRGRLLEKVIAAKGGLERLRGIKNITATTKATGLGPNAQQGTIETVTYLEYPNHVRVESKTPRGDTRPGVRRLSRVGQGSGRHPRRARSRWCTTSKANLRRDTIAALLAAADGQRQRPAAARRKGRDRRAALCDRVLGTGSRSDDSVHRSRDESRREADLRRRRTRHAARRRAVHRLPPGGRCPDRASARPSASAASRCSSAASRRSRSTRPSAPPVQTSDLLNRPARPRIFLSCGEPSGDLYAGALTRELRIARAGHRGRRARRTGVRSAAAVSCSRTIAVSRSPASPRSSRRCPQLRAAKRRLVAAARAGSSRRARRHRLLRLQRAAGARHQAARHSGRLLHQPADLGVASRPDQGDSRDCRSRARDLSVRGSDLSRRRRAGRVRRASADRSRSHGCVARRIPAAVWASIRTAPTIAVLPGSRTERTAAHSADARRRCRAHSRSACRARSSSSRARRISTIGCLSRLVACTVFTIVEGRNRCRACGGGSRR